MAWLTALEGPLERRRFALDGPFLLGRGPYNHAVLDDARISRQHAKVSPEAGGFVAYDLNSANGTFVNDVQVSRQALGAGDVLRVGPFSFRFEVEPDKVTSKGTTIRPLEPGEQLTRRGFEAPTQILQSVDIAASRLAIMPSGLGVLEDAERKLRTLYEFMQSLSTTLDEDELVDRILGNVLEVFPDAELSVVYLEQPSKEMLPTNVRGRGAAVFSSMPLPEEIRREVVERGQAILSSPLSLDEPTVSSPSGDASAGGTMHAPMLFRQSVYGVLNVRAAPFALPFRQPDLDLLAGMASHAAMALKGAYLHRESLKQQRMQQDLALAEQIQKSFLPAVLPTVAGVRFIAEYRPAFSVGGDFYDVFWLGEHQLGITIGDVSGKGVAAALLMARVSSDIRAAAMAHRPPSEVVKVVNEQLVARGQDELFVTAIYASLDIKSRMLTLANAGHLPPYVRRGRRGAWQAVDGGGGTPIGLLPNAEYEPVSLTLAPGDCVFLCSDGVVEATDGREAQWGFEGLESSLSRSGDAAKSVDETLRRDLQLHVGGASQYDDLTYLILTIDDQ